MLRTTTGLVANMSILTIASSIEGIGCGNVVDQVSVVNKGNMGYLESKIGFFILRARLAFAKLRQVFIIAPIIYHFDLKYHFRIGTNISDSVIGGVLYQLTLDGLSQ